MASNPNYCDVTPEIEALAAQDLRALAEDDQSSYAEGYNCYAKQKNSKRRI